MRLLFWGLSAALPFCAQEIALTRVAGGLTMPTDIQHAGDGSGRLFFVQQDGRIRLFQNGALAARPFLDISAKTRANGEQGLLGLAFPPGFGEKRHFYVNYTDRQGDTVIARYRVGADPDVADANSEQLVLFIDQPFQNHNGGQLRFGPDGYLYIGMGDGGSGGDPQGHGQRRSSLLGKILRIDVEGGGEPYGVPAGNPFAGMGDARPEVWATGLRNPWRFSFDRETGDLWIADVGQNRAEEVNFTPASSRGGENYGWNLMEGLQCYASASCNRQGLTLPVVEYGRGEGCSVSGGAVYRGSRFPALRGWYFYGDYCTGRIWGIRREGERWTNRLFLRAPLAVSTFGEDERGEMYVAGHNDGAIYAIEAPGGGAGAAPAFNEQSVVNAASLAPGLVPGSLATIFATGLRETQGITEAPALPLPVSLADVSVLVNGRAAPILAVASGAGGEQVNFQAPFDLPPGSRASIVLRRGDLASAPVEIGVLAFQPGVFAPDGTNAFAMDAGFRPLTAERPAPRDSVMILYATGLGAVDNPPATGGAAPADPLARARTTPQVRVGDIPAEVLYAGLAPGFAGVYQLNLRVPAAAPQGAVELVIEQSGVSSRPVRVFVQ